jgi:voltage-gated hydrogen channel 1
MSSSHSSADNDETSQPLLSTGTTRAAVDPGTATNINANTHAANPTEINPADTSAFKTHYRRHRQWLQDFLSSRTQHFCVLGLVSLDLLGIFADIFINLYTCEEGEPSPTWDAVRNGLGVAGLVFSCLFMFELILSVWAFGWRLDSPSLYSVPLLTFWFDIMFYNPIFMLGEAVLSLNVF